VMAIITIAAVKLLRLTNRRDPRLWTVSAVIFAVTATIGSEPALLIIAAGLLLVALDARPSIHWPTRRGRLARKPESSAEASPESAEGERVESADSGEPPPAGARAVLMLLPVGALGAAAGGGVLVALGLFFAKTGAIVFGSGLAIVPFLREGVVEQHHWLTPAQFLDAVAMGLITPGPVVITAGFIGYLVAGLPGAVVATVGIFTPIYLAVVIPGRWFLRHRDNPQVKAFVAGATAAAAGALAGAVVVLTRQAVTDWPTAAIALGTLVLLWRFKIPEPVVVLAAGGLGLLIH